MEKPGSQDTTPRQGNQLMIIKTNHTIHGLPRTTTGGLLKCRDRSNTIHLQASEEVTFQGIICHTCLPMGPNLGLCLYRSHIFLLPWQLIGAPTHLSPPFLHYHMLLPKIGGKLHPSPKCSWSPGVQRVPGPEGGRVLPMAGVRKHKLKALGLDKGVRPGPGASAQLKALHLAPGK